MPKRQKEEVKQISYWSTGDCLYRYGNRVTGDAEWWGYYSAVGQWKQ
jgi:hypothetical protein